MDAAGETADEIFYEAKPEAEALSVDDKDPETKEELYGSHDQKTMNAETQSPESGVKITQNAETQTTEFEYIYLSKLFCNLLLRNILLIMMTE